VFRRLSLIDCRLETHRLDVELHFLVIIRVYADYLNHQIYFISKRMGTEDDAST
jgi:hypothetical protein